MLRCVPSVLLVDDDPAILRLLEVNFRLEGFETLTAARGPEAVALAARLPDAIVLDLMLPEMDGHEVYRRLRQDPEMRAIPVIFLTARALDTTPIDPGVRYITKPFDTSALIETVRATIAGGGE
jgi:CheY-like chemotaxis protein